MDFLIHEPIPFDRKWYSHKFGKAGLRYEVGVSIQTGYIVWLNGPFKCGPWPDIKIARSNLIYQLDMNEMVVADHGYRDGFVFFETMIGV